AAGAGRNPPALPFSAEANPAGAGFGAVKSQKRVVLPGANDSVTRAGRHTASAGDLRRLDGDGSAGMGSGADIADGVTGGSAKAQPFALADRAHGRGGVD